MATNYGFRDEEEDDYGFSAPAPTGTAQPFDESATPVTKADSPVPFDESAPPITKADPGGDPLTQPDWMQRPGAMTPQYGDAGMRERMAAMSAGGQPIDDMTAFSSGGNDFGFGVFGALKDKLGGRFGGVSPAGPTDTAGMPMDPSTAAPGTAPRPPGTEEPPPPADEPPPPGDGGGDDTAPPPGDPATDPDAYNAWLSDYIKNNMANPSRYDSDLVRQGQQVIEDSINRQRQKGRIGLEEYHAGRGLTGSSLESGDMGEFEGQLQSQAQERLFNLGREQANTYAADRGGAFNAAFGFGDQIQSRQAMLMDNDYRNRSLQLQRDGMERADADRQAEREWQRERFGQEFGEDQWTNTMNVYGWLMENLGPEGIQALLAGRIPGQA